VDDRFVLLGVEGCQVERGSHGHKNYELPQRNLHENVTSR